MANRARALRRQGPAIHDDREPVRSSVALTREIARGDERAFGEFYELWFDRTFALARSISRRDEAFCLDVVQDCMLRVVRSMKPLDDEPAVHAWMGKAVLSTTLDRLRRDRRRARREEHVAPTEALHDEPARAAQDNERQNWLRDRLAELPELDRRLIFERYSGDKTLDAVGAELGITGNAAHGRIRRVLLRLRRKAEEWFDD